MKNKNKKDSDNFCFFFVLLSLGYAVHMRVCVCVCGNCSLFFYFEKKNVLLSDKTHTHFSTIAIK